MIVVDRSGRIQHLNAQTLAMFGYAQAELLNQPVEILLPERFRGRHVEHRAGFAQHPRMRPLGTGLELYGRAKDGREFPIDVMLSPLEPGEGALVLGVIRDISARRQSEETLRQTTAVFERLFELGPDAVVVADGAGRIIRVNAQTERMFGYARAELLGRQVEILLPERFKARHAGHRAVFFQQPRVRPMGAGLDLYGRRKDGSEFPVDIVLSPMETSDGAAVLSVVRDITERKQAEERERNRRDMLLKEIHHRVKNNLQVVSSLLSLQSEKVAEARYQEMFRDTQTRVKSIALVHEKLYQSGDQAHINFRDYLQDLMRELSRSYGADSRGVQITLKAEPVSFGLETAIPCGLIASELVANALKHAYPRGGHGSVYVDLWRPAASQHALRVRDHGVGLPRGLDLSATRTLGFQIVQTLTAQLGGVLRTEGPPGTAVEIVFPSSAGGA